MTFVTLIGCSSSKKISKTINHQYYNITFTPKSVSKIGVGKVKLEITPIDAASINRETFEAASRDGNYEKELALSIEKRKIELDTYSKAQRARINGRINAIELINKLERENQIPSNTAYQLKSRIWYGEEYGKDGTEVTSLSDVESYPDNFNPYKINQKYLSVFKVTFENESNEIEKINLKEFQVVSGEELLYPLGIEYFEDNLEEQPEKMKNIHRMNMPNELIITPRQRITKYLAIPAINPRNDKLQIQMIKDTKIVNFDFKVKDETLNKNYQVESYDVYTSGLADSFSYDFYCAVHYQNGVSYAAIDNRVFVSEEKKKIPVSVFVIAIHRTSSNAKNSKKLNFRFADMNKNKVVVSFWQDRKSKK